MHLSKYLLVGTQDESPQDLWLAVLVEAHGTEASTATLVNLVPATGPGLPLSQLLFVALLTRLDPAAMFWHQDTDNDCSSLGFGWLPQS